MEEKTHKHTHTHTHTVKLHNIHEFKPQRQSPDSPIHPRLPLVPSASCRRHHPSASHNDITAYTTASRSHGDAVPSAPPLGGSTGTESSEAPFIVLFQMITLSFFFHSDSTLGKFLCGHYHRELMWNYRCRDQTAEGGGMCVCCSIKRGARGEMKKPGAVRGPALRFLSSTSLTDPPLPPPPPPFPTGPVDSHSTLRACSLLLSPGVSDGWSTAQVMRALSSSRLTSSVSSLLTLYVGSSGTCSTTLGRPGGGRGTRRAGGTK